MAFQDLHYWKYLPHMYIYIYMYTCVYGLCKDYVV